MDKTMSGRGPAIKGVSVAPFAKAGVFSAYATIIALMLDKAYWHLPGTTTRVWLYDFFVVGVMAAFVMDVLVSPRHRRLRKATIVWIALYASLLVLVLLQGAMTIVARGVDSEWFGQWIRGLVKLTERGTFVLCSAWVFLRSPNSDVLRKIRAFVIIGGVVAALYGVVQLVLSSRGLDLDMLVAQVLRLPMDRRSGLSPYIPGFSRVSGTYGDPNLYGFSLLASSTVLLSRVAHRDGGSKVLGAWFLVSGVLILTVSRSAILAWLASALLLVLTLWLSGKQKPALTASAWVAGLIVVFVATAAIVAPETALSVVGARVTESEGTRIRAQLYSLVPQLLADGPVIGIGVNTFDVAFARLGGPPGWSLHSSWAMYLVETGIAGLILRVLLISVLGWMSIRTGGAARAQLSLPLVAALMGAGIGSLFNNGLDVPAQWSVEVGILVAYELTRRGSSQAVTEG